MFGSLLLVGALVAIGLPGGGQTYSIGTAPPELRPLIQRGDLVIVSVQSAVLRQLHAALAEGGPEYALKACHLESVAVARTTAKHEGVHVGRTSARLRNPMNAPPAWAADIVTRHSSRPVGDSEGFVVDMGDRVGLLRPIVEQQACAACHGPADHIAAGVRAAIAARYPGDQATGFREGDLRGWFWVELPKDRLADVDVRRVVIAHARSAYVFEMWTLRRICLTEK